jgi:hypothetical protein
MSEFLISPTYIESSNRTPYPRRGNLDLADSAAHTMSKLDIPFVTAKIKSSHKHGFF